MISYLNGFFAINIQNKSINMNALSDIGFVVLPYINNMYSNLMLICFVIYFCLQFIRKKIF